MWRLLCLHNYKPRMSIWVNMHLSIISSNYVFLCHWLKDAFPLFYINKYLSYNILLNCKIDKSCSHNDIKKLPPFWQEVLECSSKVNYETENNVSTKVLSQQIWLNRFIAEREINKKNVLLFRTGSEVAS